MRSDEDPPLPVREAADSPTCAQLDAGALGDARVVAPEESAGARVDRMDDAVAHSEIDDAVHRERRRQDVLRLEVEAPGEPEPADRCRVDLGKRAVMRLAKGATVRGPVPAVAVVGERLVVDDGRRSHREPIGAADCDRERANGADQFVPALSTAHRNLPDRYLPRLEVSMSACHPYSTLRE